MCRGGVGPEASGRVLVADDDEDLRATMADALRLAGHTVTEAADGNTTLTCLQRDRFQAIVLDMLLPGVSGVGILKELLTWSPGTRPRVIAISGGGRDMSGAHAVNLARLYASDAVLYKPFTADELVAAVRGDGTPAAPRPSSCP